MQTKKYFFNLRKILIWPKIASHLTLRDFLIKFCVQKPTWLQTLLLFLEVGQNNENIHNFSNLYLPIPKWNIKNISRSWYLSFNERIKWFKQLWLMLKEKINTIQMLNLLIIFNTDAIDVARWCYLNHASHSVIREYHLVFVFNILC